MALAAFCPNCGLPNAEGHRFCPRCGQNLVSNVVGGAFNAPSAAGGTRPQPAPASTVAAGAPAGSPPPYWYGPAGYLPPPVRRSDAVSIFIETFRAWAKDVPAYLCIFVLYGAAVVAVLLATTWAILGTAYPTTSFLTSSLSSLTAGMPASYLLVLLVAGILNAIVAVVFTAAVTYYALCKRRGARVPWSAAFRIGVRRFPRVVLGGVLLGILGYVLVLLDILPFVGGVASQPNPLFLASECGGLLFVLPALYISIALSLYAPAIMMEGVGGVPSLRRSWSLTRGHRLSIFGATLLVGVIALAVSFGATFSLTALGNVFVSTAAQIAATAVTGSWSILLAAVAYELIGEDQREGERQWAAMARVPWSALPERAPAYAQPGAPPCPTCGTALLWIPAYGRWYCNRCRAYR